MNATNYAVSAAEEIKEQLETVKSEQIVTFEKEILDAKRVFVCGAGRSLLAMKFFAMRLMQFEIVTYLVGEVCTPSIGKGDLLIVGSGSGSTPTMYTVAEKAKKAGARVALVTLNSEGKIAQLSDCVVQVGTRKIPESAMKYEEYDRDNFITVRPSGNISELATAILLDCVACRLMLQRHMDLQTLKNNHANLE